MPFRPSAKAPSKFIPTVFEMQGKMFQYPKQSIYEYSL